MTKCYIHKSKNSVRNCSECGKAMCRDCVFQEVVASRVTRYSYQYGSEVEHDYDFYCPNCFLGFAEEKGYNQSPRGVYFRFSKSPSIIALIILWSSLILGFVVNIFFPIGYILFIGTVIAMIALKVSATKNYNKYLRAQELLKPKKTDEPIITEKPMKKKGKERGNYCSVCGSNNPAGSKFCNECGNVL
jgi:hypothetical protein